MYYPSSQASASSGSKPYGRSAGRSRVATIPSATIRCGVQERIQVLAQQDQDLRGQHQRHLRLAEFCANIEVLCASLRSGLHTLDFSRRRRILELLVNRVVICKDRVKKGLYGCLIERTVD